jgi:nucleotide-binding universal stress UspA family protein
MMLGRGLPAELVLFHAVSIPSDLGRFLGGVAPKEGELLQQLETKAAEYLRGIADQVLRDGLAAKTVIQHGPAAEAIVEYAEQTGVQFIVIATHGFGGIQRWTHGSVAERVLQAAGVPVLMVRAQEEVTGESPQHMDCQHILVPLDGSELAEQVLPLVNSVAQAVGANITLFQVSVDQPATLLGGDWFFVPVQGDFDAVNRKAQAYLERTADRLRETGTQVSTAVQGGPVAESIIEYAEANHMDLVAMCTHGRTGLARWVLGSIADRLLRSGEVPILLVRAR